MVSHISGNVLCLQVSRYTRSAATAAAVTSGNQEIDRMIDDEAARCNHGPVLICQDQQNGSTTGQAPPQGDGTGQPAVATGMIE